MSDTNPAINARDLIANSDVWAMHFRDGKSHAEIAAHYGVDPTELFWLSAPVSDDYSGPILDAIRKLEEAVPVAWRRPGESEHSYVSTCIEAVANGWARDFATTGEPLYAGLQIIIDELKKALLPEPQLVLKNGRIGDWIQTFSGNPFWPMDPREDEVHIVDIAHALSQQCRFAGQCLRFYSVAEHSVLLARYFGRENSALALWALLHDAPESFIVDLPPQLKVFLKAYKPAEMRLMRAIARRFGLDPVMPAAVKDADRRILMDEAAQNMAAPKVTWKASYEPLGIELNFWTPEQAEEEFLAEFVALKGVSA